MANPQLASILDRSGHAATVAWAHDGSGSLDSLPDAELAVAAAVALGNVTALQAVESPKALRKLAAAGLHKLKSKGVSVVDRPAPVAFSLGREVLEVPPRAFLGAPNQIGHVHVVLTATNHEGTCIMEVIVGGERVNAQHGHATRTELRSFWKDMEGDGSMQEIPFLAGLKLADRFAASHSLHGWGHFMDKVPAATLDAARSATLDSFSVRAAGEPASWVLPVGGVPASLVNRLIETLEAQEGPVSDTLVESLVDSGLDAAARANFAVAAEFNAEIFALLGWSDSAARAAEVAAVLRGTTEPMPELRAAALLAAFGELEQRQQQKNEEMNSMMRMIGQQSGS